MNALKTQETKSISSEIGGTAMESFWVPVAGAPDYYVHYTNGLAAFAAAQAAAAALTFDCMPDYSLRTARFGDKTEDTVFIDIFGNTVKGSVKKLLELAKNEKLAAKWEELTNDGN